MTIVIAPHTIGNPDALEKVQDPMTTVLKYKKCQWNLEESYIPWFGPRVTSKMVSLSGGCDKKSPNVMR